LTQSAASGGARLLTRLSDKNTQNTSVNDIIETLLKDLAPLLDDPRTMTWRTGT
jgi:hypothetical protein